MKWLPGSLFFLAAAGFFIGAALGASVAAFIAIGCALFIIALVLLVRARTKP